MPKIMTMGELLCEIMRPGEGMELYETGDFKGLFPAALRVFLLVLRPGLAVPAVLLRAWGTMISGKILWTGCQEMAWTAVGS